jgi:hypothetical protein
MFDEACGVIERALGEGVRRQIVADVSGSRNFRTALLRLRDSMRSNVWKAGAAEFPLGRIVRSYDIPTRRRLSRDARLGRHRGTGSTGHDSG